MCVCVCVCVCVCIYKYTHTCYLFIHSSFDEYLVSFYVLVMVILQWTHGNIYYFYGSVFFPFSLSKSPEVYYSLIFNALRDFHASFHSALWIYNPTNSTPSFPFLHIFSNMLFLVFFLIAIITVVRWLSYCGFDLHFPMVNDVEHLFMCLLAIYMSSLEKWLFRSSAHF